MGRNAPRIFQKRRNAMTEKKEYIERGALRKKIFPYEGIDKAKYAINAKAVEAAINGTPAADVVEVQHGEWIEKPYLFGTTRYCSLCGENYGMPHGIYNYCSNCGAKMDGERKDEG
jgi:hypothetical protein